MNAPSPRWLRLLTLLIGVNMFAGGIAKLAGLAIIVELFHAHGLPYWFLMLVGTFEMLGGALLLVPKTSPMGGIIIATIMVGAIWTHLAYLEFIGALPPGLYAVACLTITWKRMDEPLAALGYRRAT